MPTFPRWWELALIFVVASIALSAVILFYDNVHRATTNGLWKSMDVAVWVERSPNRGTNSSNLLYYPVVGTLVRALPEQFFGAVWQRMAFVNAFFGAVVLALTYAIALRLFRSRSTALFACLCQLSMGFFLLLSTINEDIMPGYVWVVAAIAFAVIPQRLSPLVVGLTAQCVALSWLFHSSLQFPTIGASVLGIATWTRDARRAARQVALFCVALLPLPLVSSLLFGMPLTAGFWSSKGFSTGWAGFAGNKVVLMWSGIAQSVVGGQNESNVSAIVHAGVLSTSVTTLALAVLLVLWIRKGVRDWVVPEWRLAVTLLVSLLLLGETMNLYIQPQDPQFQIQPMTWFPFAAALLFWHVEQRQGRGTVVVRAGLVLAVVLLLAGNLRVYTDERHADSIALANARTLESIASPQRTVFLMHGFEPMATWLTLLWTSGLGASTQTDAPRARSFNVIYLTKEAIDYPNRSPKESAENVVRLVDRALDQGFDVVASDVWSSSDAQWINTFASISGPEKPQAIRAALNKRFAGTAIGNVPGWSSFYRVVRKVQ